MMGRMLRWGKVLGLGKSQTIQLVEPKKSQTFALSLKNETPEQMIKQFEHLSEDERQTLYLAVPKVALLIAGADGVIDPKEVEWAEKVAEIRTYAFDGVMQEYYEVVDSNFHEVFHEMIQSYPGDTATRTARLTEELTALNSLLGRLDPVFARHYHKSLTSFARHVAEASGGFLRMGNISKEEKDLIDLPMIQKPD